MKFAASVTERASVSPAWLLLGRILHFVQKDKQGIPSVIKRLSSVPKTKCLRDSRREAFENFPKGNYFLGILTFWPTFSLAGSRPGFSASMASTRVANFFAIFDTVSPGATE
ncbi:MAG: hypothetical protein JWQ83_1396 [Lacunisphaera sp.]|nr:hypothetical protein [Lacunisphaera sp.]MDB6166256.1 hypothetical protein [Lacunisphaera sp.]